MKIIQLFFVIISAIIAPGSALATEENRASYLAIQYIGIPDKPVATVVLTTDAAFVASWRPTDKNPVIMMLVRAYLIDPDVYAKVYDFLASEAQKRKGRSLSLDGGNAYFEISGRDISGKANISGSWMYRNAFGWSLSDDKEKFSMPLNGKESAEIMKVVAQYLTGQGIDQGLQMEMDAWR